MSNVCSTGCMRWDAQLFDADASSALPGMSTIRGLMRTVTTPEFAGVRFHEVRARSALNHVPRAPAAWRWTINPYRGCTHACVYCFARPTHSYLELDTGVGFDSEIVVKTNVVEVLERELAKVSWDRPHVALGTNTDPYQRAEGRYQLLPGIVRALAESGTPFSILTKGTLLRRDLPLLIELRKLVPIDIAISLALTDLALHEALEPGAPSPRARLGLVTACRDAGFVPTVLLAPVLPYLSDSVDHLDATIGALAAAGADRVTPLALNLKPYTREWFMGWLSAEHPELVTRYERLYTRGAYVPPAYREWLNRRVQPILERHGVAGSSAKPPRYSRSAPGSTNVDVDVDADGDGAGFGADSTAPGSMSHAAKEAAQLSLLD